MKSWLMLLGVTLFVVLLWVLISVDPMTPEDRLVQLGQAESVSRPPNPQMEPCADQAAEAKQAGFGEGWTWYCAKGSK